MWRDTLAERWGGDLMDTTRFAGRTALITGAAGGLGQAVARRLAAEGATVALSDRLATPELYALATELEGITAIADVVDPDAVHAMVTEVEDAIGPLDILVTCAAYMSMAPLLDHDIDDWWRVVDTNLGGSFFCVQAVTPMMRARGSGHIVLVSSEWGQIGWPHATAYSASKAGLIALAKTLGRELAPYGITANAVAPSVIDTPQLQVDADEAGVTLNEIRERYAEIVPLKRIASPDEIAAAVAYLADPRISALVGQVLCTNGGTTRARN